MGQPSSVQCPHCAAPLAPSEGAEVVRCQYCGHRSRLHHTRTAPNAPVTIRVSDITRRVRIIVVTVTLAMVLGIGAVVAVVVIGATRVASETQSQIDRTTSESMARAERMTSEALDRAERMTSEALDRAAEARAGATETRPAEKLPAEKAESARRTAGTRKPPPALPPSPDRAEVVRALEGLDLSACPGPSTITYGVKVNPDGSTRTTSAGPMQAKGGALGCVRAAIQGLRFPATRAGLELKHAFVVPGSAQ